MEKTVSIKDVAQKAGVSISTVSRVFNNGPSITESTKRRVLQAVKELNYRPNFAAKALRDGTSKTIALVVPNISNPSYAMIAHGLESVVQAKNYNVILVNTNDDLAVEIQHVESLKNRLVDGFVFATAREGDQHINALINADIPVVEVMRCSGETNAVATDNYKIGYEATKYLIEHGCKKIFMLSDDTKNISFIPRTEGYRRALADYHLEHRPEYELYAHPTKPDELSTAVVNAIRKYGCPDAFFCANDSKALGVYAAARKLNLRIPEDLAVFGVDNVEFTQFLDPPLTTIEQPFHAMGEKAAEVLLKEIETKSGNGDEFRTFYRVVLPTKLIERQSVAAKPETD